MGPARGVGPGGRRRLRPWRAVPRQRHRPVVAARRPRVAPGKRRCAGGQPATGQPGPTALWYPIWDEKLKLGHAVRSLSGTLDLAASDIDTATGARRCPPPRRRRSPHHTAHRGCEGRLARPRLGAARRSAARREPPAQPERRGGIPAGARSEDRPRRPAGCARDPLGTPGGRGHCLPWTLHVWPTPTAPC